ncbi:MAG TPA: YciI family protein [Polyangia bacterium]|nr:YciI family protein [Polyangia bacterium]
MRFMLMVRATKDSESGAQADPEMLAAMGKFNEEMVKAGVMLAGEGLQPSSKGARIRFSGGKQTVVDGPFAETKELIAGFWILQCRSKEEALEWAKRCPQPMPGDCELELRQVFSAEDFAYAGEDVVRKENELRSQVEAQSRGK